MGEDKSMHPLEMRRQRGSANTNGGGEMHALPRDEETRGGRGLRTANTEGGGQKHTLARNEKTKGGQRTANTDGGGQ